MSSRPKREQSFLPSVTFSVFSPPLFFSHGWICVLAALSQHALLWQLTLSVPGVSQLAASTQRHVSSLVLPRSSPEALWPSSSLLSHSVCSFLRRNFNAIDTSSSLNILTAQMCETESRKHLLHHQEIVESRDLFHLLSCHKKNYKSTHIPIVSIYW